MILIITGIIIHLLLFNTFNDTSLIFEILYDYSSLDIRFLISIFFQLYWLIILYKCVFQYIDINTFLQIRLSSLQKVIFYLKKLFIFSIIYIIFQLFIMIFYQYYPWDLILYNLLCYFIYTLTAIIILKNNDYIFVIMTICSIILRLL